MRGERGNGLKIIYNSRRACSRVEEGSSVLDTVVIRGLRGISELGQGVRILETGESVPGARDQRRRP